MEARHSGDVRGAVGIADAIVSDGRSSSPRSDFVEVGNVGIVYWYSEQHGREEEPSSWKMFAVVLRVYETAIDV